MASRTLFLALCSLASGFTLGEVPTQTLGLGEPFTGVQPAPTSAPRLELVKKRLGLEKKAATNFCSEWTIPGGFGQPFCENSKTCVFTSADDGYLYEGCGKTDSANEWVTACWNYPMTGSPPVSELYCGSDAPYCGFMAFIIGPQSTYVNFGCSTVTYEFTVNLLETAAVLDPITTSTPVAVNPGATTPSPKSTSPNSLTTSPAPKPTSSKKKSTIPLAPIIGGVVGGVIFLAFAFFLTWYLLRRQRRTTNYPPPPAPTPQTYTSPPPPPAPVPAPSPVVEKPIMQSTTTEFYQPASLRRQREEEERAAQGAMIYIPPAGYERGAREPPTYISGGEDQGRPVSPMEGETRGDANEGRK